ncbi:MAG: C39 family peptidase [Lachnospiraceae bacterium]|nr:C39 family peptidase [Lachnospiraceae bacterium]
MDKVFEDVTGESGEVDENAGPVTFLTPTLMPDGSLSYDKFGKVTATPTPEIVNGELTTCDKYVYVVDIVNVREKATTQSLILGSVKADDKLHCLGEMDTGWTLVAYNHKYAFIRSSYLTEKEPKQVATEHIDTIEYMRNIMEKDLNAKLLNVSNILQTPQLPTGGEVTCLAIVLNYMGYPIDKKKLAADYLPMGSEGNVSPFKAFIGDPTKNGSFGCYAGAIVEAGKKYLDEQFVSNIKVQDISGSEMLDLLSYIDKGVPVIAWCTENLRQSTKGKTWTIDNEEVTWKGKECAVVIIGYNLSNDTLLVADPSQGIVEWNIDLFYKRYQEQYSQAVVVY